MRKAALIVLPLFFSLILTGCWNYRELETLAIVAGFSIDKGESGSGYRLTFEILDESGGGGGGESGGQSTVKSVLLQTEGNTIFDAARNAVQKLDKKLYFGDCKAIVVSSSLASEGIAPLMDWINRDSEPRLTSNLFVSKGNTAEEILERKGLTNPITSYALDKMDTNNPKYLSKAPFIQLYKINNVLGGEGASLVLPALSVSANPDKDIPQIAGTAVFKKDKLLGFLGSEESKYLSFIRDQVKGGLLVFNNGGGAPDITLEIKKNKTSVSVPEGNSFKIRINVKTEVSLAEMTSSKDYETESGIGELERTASAYLAESIRQLISKVKNEYGSDIFGFGSAVYRSYPKYWKEIKPKWDDMFRALDVDVSADVKIKDTALIKSNVKVACN
jgi:spore germination protein KC